MLFLLLSHFVFFNLLYLSALLFRSLLRRTFSALISSTSFSAFCSPPATLLFFCGDGASLPGCQPLVISHQHFNLDNLVFNFSFSCACFSFFFFFYFNKSNIHLSNSSEKLNTNNWWNQFHASLNERDKRFLPHNAISLFAN